MTSCDLFDISVDPHVLYHVSPRKFDFPNRAEINAAREWSQWHPNGLLGLWCSTAPKMCAGFGKHVYRVVLKPEAVRKGLAFGTLYLGTRDLEHLEQFQPMIDDISQSADVVYIKDGYDVVGEVIIFNFDAISEFVEVDGADNFECRLEVVS